MSQKITQPSPAKQKPSNSDPRLDLAIPFVFIITSLILFNSKIDIISWGNTYPVILFLIGLVSFGIGIDNLSENIEKFNKIQEEKKTKVFQDITLGVGVVLIWIIIDKQISNPFIEIFISFILILGFAGISLGIVGIFYKNFSSKKNNSEIKELSVKKNILESIGAIIILLISVMWILTEPGFEPLLAVLGAMLITLNLFVKGQKTQIIFCILMGAIALIGAAIVSAIRN